MLGMLTLTTDPERSFLPFRGDGEDSVVLLVNNLGGTSELEMGGIVAQTCRSLEEMRISVKRILSGTFMVSSTERVSRVVY
jgi:dihydroxyacetone kinase